LKRLLFVDDEPRILQGIKAGLYTRRREWDMHFVERGAEAIELMRESPFDVLVTDLRMPGVDGTTIVARARSDSPSTIRVVLSGYGDERQSQGLVSLAHRYLTKPCAPKELEQCIDRCLATQALIESPELRQRLGAVGALPPIPGTFAALQRALADPAIELSKISSIIERDPSVSAKVLQVCNSAFFRLPRRATGIRQAVNYLGLSTVRSMVLSTELFQPGKALSPALDLGQMQRHALSVAAVARALAADALWAEDAFLAGLLHDVGLLLLARQYKDQMQQALESAAAGMPLGEAEQKYVGVCHGVAGAYLLGLWGLPFDVVEAVANHAVPTQVSHSGLDVLSAVAIAEALVLQIRPHDVPAFEAAPAMVTEEALLAMGIPQRWESLVECAAALLGGAERD
jgi:HD-like signal output (HDOD) protein